jgi:predicted RNase H-like nuclease
MNKRTRERHPEVICFSFFSSIMPLEHKKRREKERVIHLNTRKEEKKRETHD